MKKRTAAIVLAAATAMAMTTSVFAADYRVGIIKYVDDASLDQIEQAIMDELDAKSAEGEDTYSYEGLVYNGQADGTQLATIEASLIDEEPDIIIPIATPVVTTLLSALEDSDIPVVFSAVSDPVGAGIVDSMEAPGMNVTGTSDALNTNAIFDLITTANPEIKKVGLLYSQSEDSSTQAIADAKAYLENAGIEYVEKTGTNDTEVIQAAAALVDEGVEAIFTPTDNTIMKAELAIFETFAEAGIPHYAGADSFALNGAFCGYGVNYEQLGTETADMAIEILKGADPAVTPVKTFDNGIVTINTEIAEQLGIDYSAFADSDACSQIVETVTAESFE
ncbi:MAG: ABC transporter substrate-binding protein [Blautia sp.]|nr:ABC transporter substrate-binding protein [Blautia sp.]MDY5032120.1 ABC transporter substrate-binding protein [Blautia sp.]